MLYNVGLDEDVQILCDQMGRMKFVNLKYNTFFELIIEFYTKFKIIDEKEQIYSYRFFGMIMLLCIKYLGFLKGIHPSS